MKARSQKKCSPAWDAFPEERAVSPLQIPESQVKRILVAVDFSETSREALEFAAALAKRLGAEIALLHVFEGVPGELRILEAAWVDTSFREEAARNLAEWTNHLRAAGVTVSGEVREAAAVGGGIIGMAQEAKVDLIVIGRHGTRGVERIFASNTVARVLRHAPCPVLVV